MINRNVARGCVLVFIATAFGAGALGYPVEKLSRPGPGLFPLLVSALLMALGVVTIVQARTAEFKPLDFNLKNIALIMTALVGFVVIALYVHTALAIVFLVFVASYAGVAPSWKRNLQISAALVVIAFLFQYFFGLNLKVI